MKKIISAFIVAVMVISCFALAVSANLSEQGTITIVRIDEKSAADALTIAKIKTIAAEAEAWTKGELPKELPDDTKDYGFFELELTEEAKSSGIDEYDVTLSVPGITGSNSPVILIYNETENKFEIAKDIKVNGSEIAFTAKFTNGTSKCNILYKIASTSPETGVPAAAMITLAVVALIGAAYTGKKAFN